MSITIREYQGCDLPTCKDLWRELTQRHRDIYFDPSIGGDDSGLAFELYLKRGDLAGVWVAEDGSDPIAMAGLLLAGQEAEVEPIVVRSSSRSRGVGTVLLRRLKAEAAARGARFLSIRPVARNLEAITCFHRAGFALLGHVDMFIDLQEQSGRQWLGGVTLHGCRFRF
jgi:GNAT superfamily N-acetyltransferase